MQPTLVAYYGEKPDTFLELIQIIQRKLCDLFPAGAYMPYDNRQIHSTIVGLEGIACSDGKLVNKNFLELRGEAVSMDLDGALTFIATTKSLPLPLSIGGYQLNSDIRFTSMGWHPYYRSFLITGSTATLIGWPGSKSDRYLGALHRLRCEFKRYNILHKYLADNDCFDDDFYISLGKLDQDAVDQETIQHAQNEIRSYLAARESLVLPLAAEHISVVGYNRKALSLEDSISIPVTMPSLDGDFLRRSVWFS